MMDFLALFVLFHLLLRGIFGESNFDISGLSFSKKGEGQLEFETLGLVPFLHGLLGVLRFNSLNSIDFVVLA